MKDQIDYDTCSDDELFVEVLTVTPDPLFKFTDEIPEDPGIVSRHFLDPNNISGVEELPEVHSELKENPIVSRIYMISGAVQFYRSCTPVGVLLERWARAKRNFWRMR